MGERACIKITPYRPDEPYTNDTPRGLGRSFYLYTQMNGLTGLCQGIVRIRLYA